MTVNEPPRCTAAGGLPNKLTARSGFRVVAALAAAALLGDPVHQVAPRGVAARPRKAPGSGGLLRCQSMNIALPLGPSQDGATFRKAGARMTKRQQRRRDERRRQAQSTMGARRLATGATLAVGVSLMAPAIGNATTFTVTNDHDSGAGSLRQAVIDANGSSNEADEIVFDSTVTGSIQLTSGPISITDVQLDINGRGPDVLKIEQTTDDRIFDVGTYGASFSGLTLTGGNPAGDGGAIRSDGSANLDHMVLTANNAGGDGGALLTKNMSFLSDSTISGNSAAGSGGGIASDISNGTSAYLRIDNSTISGNDAGGHGGGIFSGTHNQEFPRSGADNYAVHVYDSTISGNTAQTGGGGLSSRSEPQQFCIPGSTYYYPGGSYYTDPYCYTVTPGDGPTISNSILGDNTVAAGGNDIEIAGNSKDANVDYSLVENATSSDIADGGGNIFSTDPQLNPLAANGGPTPTQAPAATSPVVDKGKTTTDHDQHGEARPYDNPSIANAGGGDGSDMGAVELQAPAQQPPPPGNQGSGGGGQPSGSTTQQPGTGNPAPVTSDQPAGNQPSGGRTDGTLVVGALMKANAGGVTFTVSCGTAPCNGSVALSTIQVVRNGNIVTLARAKRKRVRIGSKTFTVTAGRTQKFTVKFNAKGRKLLKRFGRMPVVIGVNQNQNGRQVTVRKAVKVVKLKRKH